MHPKRSGTRSKVIVGAPMTPAELRARLTDIVDGLRFATKADLYRIAVSAELTREVQGAHAPSIPHAARHVMVQFNPIDPARPRVYAPAELLEFLEGQILDHPRGRAPYEQMVTPPAEPFGEWDGD